jgi:hypothetical protein
VAGVYFYVERNDLNSAVQVGAVATITTTGVQCNDSSMPQAAQAVEQDPKFADLSEGLCYNFLGESQGVMTFANYNGTISYPCGDAPVQPSASEILANVTAAQSVLSARLLSPSQLVSPQRSCDSPAGRGLGFGRRVDNPSGPAVERDA